MTIEVKRVWWDGDKLMAEPIPVEDLYPKALTKQEVEDAWNESAGAKDRLKAFYAGLDDKLWRKNKLRQYKEQDK